MDLAVVQDTRAAWALENPAVGTVDDAARIRAMTLLGSARPFAREWSVAARVVSYNCPLGAKLTTRPYN
jgi:hypothetical protein